MKKPISSLLGLITLTIFGCQSASDPMTPITPCLLTQEQGTSSSSSYTNRYTYTTSGYLLSATLNDTKLNGNTTTATTTQNTYDANDFLTISEQESVFTTSNNSQFSSKTITNYIYQNGLLVEKVSETTSLPAASGRVLRVYYTYAYDIAGNLTSITIASSINFGTPFTKVTNYSYTNGVISGISENATGTTQAYTIQVDNNGRITSEIIPGGSRNLYTYNADGYLTRKEMIVNNQPNNIQEYQYDTKKATFKGLEPKGHPVLKCYGNTPQRNLTNYVYTITALTPNQVNTVTSTYQYGANNVPTSATRVTVTANNNNTTTTLNESITYATSGCN